MDEVAFLSTKPIYTEYCIKPCDIPYIFCLLDNYSLKFTFFATIGVFFGVLKKRAKSLCARGEKQLSASVDSGDWPQQKSRPRRAAFCVQGLLVLKTIIVQRLLSAFARREIYRRNAYRPIRPIVPGYRPSRYPRCRDGYIADRQWQMYGAKSIA